MSVVLDALSWACLLLGSGFSILGGIGMIRMPDFYTRAHAAGLTDTLGAGLILLGLALQTELDLVTVKLVMVLMLIYVTSPTACHALVKAAFSSGVRAFSFDDPAGRGQSGGTG